MNRLHHIAGFCFAFFISTAATKAGSSVSRAEIEPILRAASGFDSLFGSGLRLAETGKSLRLGRHYGSLSGHRVGPYQFPARFPQDPPESFPYVVTLRTTWFIQDADGEKIEGVPASGASGLEVVESLETLEIGLAGAANSSAEDQAEQAMGGKAAVARARKIFAEVNAAKLDWEELEAPFDVEVGGAFKKGRLEGNVRKTELYFNLGAHGGSQVETYYTPQGEPVFALYTSSTWTFTGPEETTDKVRQRRFYFANGVCMRALEKQFSFKDRASQSEVAQKAPNRTLDISEQSGRRVYRPLAALPGATGPQAVVLVNEFGRSQRRLSEPAMSLDIHDWGEVQLKEPIPPQALDLSPGDAVFNMLVSAGIIPEDQNEMPREVYTERLSEEGDPIRKVVLTLDGLRDDSIAAMRYLVELKRGQDGWQLLKIGRQVRPWADRDEGPAEWLSR